VKNFVPAAPLIWMTRRKCSPYRWGRWCWPTVLPPLNPAVFDTYGYGKYPGVVTGLEFERILSASGPFEGHVVRPSDQKRAQEDSLAPVRRFPGHQPGSHSYCSGVVACMPLNRRSLPRSIAGGDLETAIFFMDMRTYGKDFERFYKKPSTRPG